MRTNFLRDIRRPRGNADDTRLSDTSIIATRAIAKVRASRANDRASLLQAAQKCSIKHVKIFCTEGPPERFKTANLTRIERIAPSDSRRRVAGRDIFASSQTLCARKFRFQECIGEVRAALPQHAPS